MIIRDCRKMTPNEQGFAMLGDLKIVRPEPLPIEKQMYKITTKSLTDVCPARTTAAMLLMMKITTSSPNIAKPHVSGSFYFNHLSIVSINVCCWSTNK